MARKGFLRVAGVIENMGPSVGPDGQVTSVFGTGGGALLAADIGVPLLGSVPLDARVAEGGDAGAPVALADPSSPAGAVFAQLSQAIEEDVAPPVRIADCSLRGALLRAGADLDAARQRSYAPPAQRTTEPDGPDGSRH
jgi:ATP-binding protein involved in chromosome partitioning